MELLGTGGEGGTDPVQKNTVFFDQVRVPAFTLVGGENNGWKAASTHLELEHGAGGRIGRHRVWDRLLRLLPADETGRHPAHPARRHPRPPGRHLHQDRGPAPVRPAQLLADVRQAPALLRGATALVLPQDDRPLDDRRHPRSGRARRAHHRPDVGLARGLPRAAAAQRHHRRAPRRHHRRPAHQHGAADRHRPSPRARPPARSIDRRAARPLRRPRESRRRRHARPLREARSHRHRHAQPSRRPATRGAPTSTRASRATSRPWRTTTRSAAPSSPATRAAAPSRPAPT